jgi:hypothetical protein
MATEEDHMIRIEVPIFADVVGMTTHHTENRSEEDVMRIDIILVMKKIIDIVIEITEGAIIKIKIIAKNTQILLSHRMLISGRKWRRKFHHHQD